MNDVPICTEELLNHQSRRNRAAEVSMSSASNKVLPKFRIIRVNYVGFVQQFLNLNCCLYAGVVSYLL